MDVVAPTPVFNDKTISKGAATAAASLLQINTIDVKTMTCDVCRLHLLASSNSQKSLQERLAVIEGHTQSNSNGHKNRRHSFMETLFFLSIPKPLSATPLDQLIFDHELKVKVDEVLLQEVDSIVLAINDLMVNQEDNLDAAKVRIFGSFVTGFAIKGVSDVNLDLYFEDDVQRKQQQQHQRKKKNLHAVLESLFEVLDSNSRQLGITRVSRDYSSSPNPKVRFCSEKSSIPFEVSCSGERTVQTSTLLSKYARIDPRVTTLTLVLRSLMHAARLDDQESGSWPSISFALLVIAFMQKKRLLPYLLPPAALFKNKDKKDDNRTWNNDEEDGHDAQHDVDCDVLKGIDDQEHHRKNTTTTTTSSTGILFLELLRFYGFEFPAGKFVVTTRGGPSNSEDIKHTDKAWGTKILSIEEPLRPHLNLSRSVANRDTFRLFINVIRRSFALLALQDDKRRVTQDLFTMNNIPFSYVKNAMAANALKDIERTWSRELKECHQESGSGDTNEHLINNLSNLAVASQETTTEDNDQEDDDDDEDQEDNPALQVKKVTLLALKHSIVFEISLPLTDNQEQHHQQHQPIRTVDQLFRETTLRACQSFCHVCRKHGHIARHCPQEVMPSLIAIPIELKESNHVSFEWLSKILESTIIQKHRLREETQAMHQKICSSIESLIREHLLPEAVITLFGSAVNGFGSEDSDLDLCLTIQGKEELGDLDASVIITDLSKLIPEKFVDGTVTDVLAVIHARIPILKFKLSYSRRTFDVDISLYNRLGCSNSLLLQTYSRLDRRVSRLGLVVKFFARVVDVCDASRGSLSSYAYTLMTIFFLQRIGVLPVLQEMVDESTERKLVEGYDVTFLSDVDQINSKWTTNQNYASSSVGCLFVQFLRFFSIESQVFDFDTDVVCIRSSTRLTRIDKEWSLGSKRIAIEDPFELKHNLGQGLTHGMASFIRASIITSRNHVIRRLIHYSNEVNRNPISLLTEGSTLFDRKSLTPGYPMPTGRGCRVCGRVAHRAKDCPQLKARPQHQLKSCFSCGQVGHFVSTCPLKARQQQYNRNNRRQQPFNSQPKSNNHNNNNFRRN